MIAAIVLRLRRRAAAFVRDAADRLLFEAQQLAYRLVASSGVISGCGCTSRYDFECRLAPNDFGLDHCACDCHERCDHCPPEVNARRRRDP